MQPHRYNSISFLALHFATPSRSWGCGLQLLARVHGGLPLRPRRFALLGVSPSVPCSHSSSFLAFPLVRGYSPPLNRLFALRTSSLLTPLVHSLRFLPPRGPFFGRIQQPEWQSDGNFTPFPHHVTTLIPNVFYPLPGNSHVSLGILPNVSPPSHNILCFTNEIDFIFPTHRSRCRTHDLPLHHTHRSPNTPVQSNNVFMKHLQPHPVLKVAKYNSMNGMGLQGLYPATLKRMYSERPSD